MQASHPQAAFLGGRRQQGAALVIGLLLLLVLTLLAVSSMNSASLEFIMAGNEQYRTNAFQAAEAGISQTFAQANWSPDAGAQNFNGPINASDTWASTVTLPVGTAPQPAPNNTVNTFTGYQFEIQSTGTSTRGASAVNTQGLWVLAPGGQSFQKE